MRIDEALFASALDRCKRWSQKSKDIVRDAVLEGKATADIAAAHGVSLQHVGVLRNRFLGKLREARVHEFMKIEQPLLAPAIDAFSADMLTLRDKGYTVEQIVSYLSKQGIVATTHDVMETLRKHRA